MNIVRLTADSIDLWFSTEDCHLLQQCLFHAGNALDLEQLTVLTLWNGSTIRLQSGEVQILARAVADSVTVIGVHEFRNVTGNSPEEAVRMYP